MPSWLQCTLVPAPRAWVVRVCICVRQRTRANAYMYVRMYVRMYGMHGWMRVVYVSMNECSCACACVRARACTHTYTHPCVVSTSVLVCLHAITNRLEASAASASADDAGVFVAPLLVALMCVVSPRDDVRQNSRRQEVSIHACTDTDTDTDTDADTDTDTDTDIDRKRLT